MSALPAKLIKEPISVGTGQTSSRGVVRCRDRANGNHRVARTDRCNYRHRIFALLTSLVALLVAQPAQAAHDRVRYALVDEPKSLNPLFLDGTWATMMAELAYEPLLRLGPNFRALPALATEEPTVRNGGISRDGLHITFHLRPGTYWSDGAAVTSADIKFSVDEVLNPANVIGNRSGFDQIRAMHLPNAQTIVFDLKRPDAYAYAQIAFTAPLPKHLLSSYPNLNHAPYNALPVGNGPYSVVEWKRGDIIRLKANARYWRGRPKVSLIDIHVVPSPTTALLQLKTHENDLVLVSPSEVDQLPANGIVRHTSPSLDWMQLGFNLANPKLADARVRHAIMLAIDRNKLAATVGHGLFNTDRTMLPMFQWALDSSVTPPAFDAAESGRLLDEAGWKIDADGLRRKGDETLRFTMVSRAGGDGVLAATVAAYLEQVHIRVDQKPLQAAILYDTAAAGGTLATGKYDLALLSFETNPDPDVSWLFACDQRAPAGFNYWQYCNPRLDADLKEQASTFDRRRRTRALAAVQRELMAEAAFDPLFRIDYLWVGADWLHGLNPSPWGPFWNVYAWTTADP